MELAIVSDKVRCEIKLVSSSRSNHIKKFKLSVFSIIFLFLKVFFISIYMWKIPLKKSKEPII